MRKLDSVLAWALVVLGIIHCSAIAGMHPFSLGTVWFFSGGAAFVITGLLNVVRIRSADEFARAAAVTANLLTIVVLAGVTWFLAHRLRQNPQVIVAWVLAGGELLLSLRGRR